jgi:hypothetical protein
MAISAMDVLFRNRSEAYCNARPFWDTAVMTSDMSSRRVGEAY